ncbi:hypothetical protein BCS42_15785 [Crenothrix sp. D3]|nr:hypothetical protein BCS42_15785 [Crenothrix sp. D3]
MLNAYNRYKNYSGQALADQLYQDVLDKFRFNDTMDPITNDSNNLLWKGSYGGTLQANSAQTNANIMIESRRYYYPKLNVEGLFTDLIKGSVDIPNIGTQTLTNSPKNPVWRGLYFSGEPTAAQTIANDMKNVRNTYYSNYDALLNVVQSGKITTSSNDNLWNALNDGWGGTRTLSPVQERVLVALDQQRLREGINAREAKQASDYVITSNNNSTKTPAPVDCQASGSCGGVEVITNTDDAKIPSSMFEALESSNPKKALISYVVGKSANQGIYLSKAEGQGISTAISFMHSVFVEFASSETFSKYMGDSSIYSVKWTNFEKYYMKTVDEFFLKPTAIQRLKEAASSARKSALSGTLADIVTTIIADEIKADMNLNPNSFGGAMGDYAIDVFASALKNAAIAGFESPKSFVLAFQIGFTSDMAAMSASKVIQLGATYNELQKAEGILSQSYVNGIQTAQKSTEIAGSYQRYITSDMTEHDRGILLDKAKRSNEIGQNVLTDINKNMADHFDINMPTARLIMSVVASMKKDVDSGKTDFNSFSDSTKTLFNSLAEQIRGGGSIYNNESDIITSKVKAFYASGAAMNLLATFVPEKTRNDLRGRLYPD